MIIYIVERYRENLAYFSTEEKAKAFIKNYILKFPDEDIDDFFIFTAIIDERLND